MCKFTGKTLGVTVVAATLWDCSAQAHHGWNWTEDKQTEMTGEITEIFIGPPLRVQPLPNSNFHD